MMERLKELEGKIQDRHSRDQPGNLYSAKIHSIKEFYDEDSLD